MAVAMSLRQKTILILTLTLISLMLVTYVVLSSILLTSYTQLENDRAKLNVERVLNAIQESETNLTVTTKDYAEWDDTYEFVESRDLDYISNSFGENGLADLDASLMIIANDKKEVIWSVAYDQVRQIQKTIPQELADYLNATGIFLDPPEEKNGVEGIITLPDGLYLISARPILTTADTGPMRGTFIIGRLFDDEEAKKLTELTNLPVSFIILNDESLTPDLQAIIDSFSPESRVVLQPETSQLLKGYGLLRDINGRPVVLVQLTLDRDIYQQALANLRLLLLALVLIGMVFGMVVIIAIERQVLARLAYLSTAVNQISESGNLSQRFSDPNQDELSGLMNNINTMLDKLANSQEQLQQAKEAAEAANQAKSEFVSLISHELRSPMTSIKGFAQILQKGNQSDENQKKFLQIITVNTDRMASLVADLADISRIESGHLLVQPTRVSLADTVEEVIDSVHGQIEAKKQKVVVDLPANLPKIWADRSRLAQVLTNLITNAIKYTLEEGMITISASYEPSEGEERATAVKVAIIDTGIGLRPEDQERIFGKFFRALDEKTRNVSGTGLGLHITRYLVEAQNGRIWFESVYGQGTTFHFTIPIAPPIV